MNVGGGDGEHEGRKVKGETWAQITSDPNNKFRSWVEALLQREIQSHRIVLQLDLARDLPPVLANELQVEQVLVNLLRNAIVHGIEDEETRRAAQDRHR